MAENIVGVVGTREDGCEVVCTLPEASLGERTEWVRREILPHVRGQRRTPDGFELSFAPGSDVRNALERWSELERSCCQEARFEISEGANALHLQVHGIDPKGNVLAELLDSGEAPTESAIVRIAKAGGIGALGSFFLLCVVPMGIMAVAGASVAAPLARLESPPTLAAGALLVGGGWWLWRRRRTRAQADAGCGC